MYLMKLSVMLADAAAPAAQPSPMDLLRGPLVPLVIIMAGFLYVTNRSQKKKAKQHEEKIKSLKSGDKVVTTSGIIATVVTVKETSVSIRSADSKLEVTKGAITEILERAGESSAS
jgi:preprotein translocase subunit YajC